MKIAGVLTSLQINEDRPGDSLNIRTDEPNKASRLITIYGLTPTEIKGLAPYLGCWCRLCLIRTIALGRHKHDGYRI